MAGVYNFTIEKGADFSRTVTWYTDAAGTTAKNLTGYSARMSVKTNNLATTVLTSTGVSPTISLTLGGAAGTILIAITSTVTTALTPTAKNALAYDLELVSGAGFVTRLLQGHVTVSAEVTT